MDTASLIAKLGMNNSEFRAKLKDSVDETKGFERGWKDIGKLFAAGGVTGAVISFFSDAIDAAGKSTDATDENAAAVRRFGATVGELKGFWDSVKVGVTGALNQAGEWIGKQIALVKYGKEQVATAEAIEKQMQQTLAAIEKDKKLTEEIGKIRGQISAVQAKTAEEAQKLLSFDDQILAINVKIQAAKNAIAAAGDNRLERAKAELALETQRGELLKVEGEKAKQIAAEDKKARDEKAAEQKKTVEAHIADQDKLADLKEQWDDEEMERAVERARVERESNEEKLKDFDLQYSILEQQGTSREQMIATLKGLGFAEDEILAKLEKQTAQIEFQIKLKSKGRGDTALSDRVLEDKVATLRADIARMEAADFGSPYRNPFLPQLRKELSFAQDELGDRNRIRGQVSTFGEDGAARFYRGDMPNFERLLKFVGEQTEGKKTLSVLEEINDRLRPVFEKNR